MFSFWSAKSVESNCDDLNGDSGFVSVNPALSPVPFSSPVLIEKSVEKSVEPTRKASLPRKLSPFHLPRVKVESSISTSATSVSPISTTAPSTSTTPSTITPSLITASTKVIGLPKQDKIGDEIRKRTCDKAIEKKTETRVNNMHKNDNTCECIMI